MRVKSLHWLIVALLASIGSGVVFALAWGIITLAIGLSVPMALKTLGLQASQGIKLIILGGMTSMVIIGVALGTFWWPSKVEKIIPLDNLWNKAIGD